MRMTTAACAALIAASAIMAGTAGAEDAPRVRQAYQGLFEVRVDTPSEFMAGTYQLEPEPQPPICVAHVTVDPDGSVTAAYVEGSAGPGCAVASTLDDGWARIVLPVDPTCGPSGTQSDLQDWEGYKAGETTVIAADRPPGPYCALTAVTEAPTTTEAPTSTTEVTPVTTGSTTTTEAPTSTTGASPITEHAETAVSVHRGDLPVTGRSPVPLILVGVVLLLAGCAICIRIRLH